MTHEPHPACVPILPLFLARVKPNGGRTVCDCMSWRNCPPTPQVRATAASAGLPMDGTKTDVPNAPFSGPVLEIGFVLHQRKSGENPRNPFSARDFAFILPLGNWLCFAQRALLVVTPSGVSLGPRTRRIAFGSPFDALTGTLRARKYKLALFSQAHDASSSLITPFL